MERNEGGDMKSKRAWLWVGLAFLLGLVVMGGIAALLTNIQMRKAEAVEYPLKTVEIGNRELDPAVWGQNFPRQYDTFKKTRSTTTRRPTAGRCSTTSWRSTPFSSASGRAMPSPRTSEERGHFYALIDQKETRRQQAVRQPGPAPTAMRPKRR
jgi:nitrite reductase (cytochrome c-552)